MTHRGWLRAFTLLALLIVLILFIIFQGIETQLKAAGAAGGVIELELAFSAERAATLIQAWPAGGSDLARRALWLDFLFIVGYAGGLTALLVQLAASPRLTSWAPALRRLTPLPLIAGALDILENICLLAVVATMPSAGPLSLLAGVFASVKFALVGIALLAVLLAGAWSLRRESRTGAGG
ncbi:MAG: hypothetical protein WAV74_04090 [Anaerolineae bacterium]